MQTIAVSKKVIYRFDLFSFFDEGQPCGANEERIGSGDRNRGGYP